jgi:hypothetical protein
MELQEKDLIPELNAYRAWSGRGYGIIDTNDKILIPFEYQDMDIRLGTICVLKCTKYKQLSHYVRRYETDWYAVNDEPRIVIKPQKRVEDEIEYIEFEKESGLISVLNGYNMVTNFCDKNGQKLFSVKGQDITYYSHIGCYVYKKDPQTLAAFDINGNVSEINSGNGNIRIIKRDPIEGKLGVIREKTTGTFIEKTVLYYELYLYNQGRLELISADGRFKTKSVGAVGQLIKFQSNIRGRLQ